MILLSPAAQSLIGAAATNGESSGEMGRAWALFAVLAILLISFFIAVALVSVMRWRRQREEQPRPQPRDTDVNAWEESGRRTEPY